MIKIYICDDNSDFLKTIENKINACILSGRFADFEYGVNTFTDPDVAVKRIKENPPDIIFLDIDMPGTNGFDIASDISRNNPDIIIIFVTSHDNYVFSSLQYRPFRFIRKSYVAEELSEALNSALKELICRNRYLKLGSKYFNEKIFLSNIVCFESKRNYAEITADDGQKYMYRSTISKLEDKLGIYGFVRVQAAFLVNMKHIHGIVKNSVIMDNGLEINISRRLVNDVKSEYSKYLRE